MKKLINAPDTVVAEALDGMEAAHGNLIKVHRDPNFIVRADAPVRARWPSSPAEARGMSRCTAGSSGVGMLDAACPGAVFTSPTPDQMLEATKAVDGGAGVLHIVKNYTGDVLNFQMAAELASGDDIEVESVVIDDDVAVKDFTWTAGRRGVGATVLAEDLRRAGGNQGAPEGGRRSLSQGQRPGRSMGMALTACTVPHAGKPSFDLGEDEMEIGIGIHGEPGRRRVKLELADRITEMLMEPILSDLPFKSGDNVLMFVNGMGGTPLIELYVVYRKAYEIARKHGLNVVRNLVGSYITSLEMAGASITLLKLDDEMTRCWDAPVVTPGLRWGA